MGTFLRKNSPIELVVKNRPKTPAAAPQVARVGALKHRKVRIIEKYYTTRKLGRRFKPDFVT